MNICVVCHYFWPEICAPSARLKEMADIWVAEGHKVTVVTNFPNHPNGVLYPEYTKKSFMTETIGGIKVLRCLTYVTPNQGIVKKTLGHLLFALAAPLQVPRYLKNTDIIIISSPPLFTGIGALWLSCRLRCPYIIEIRDLWPAIFVELGILRNRFLIKILELFELYLYKKSCHVVALTQAFADDIVQRKIPANKVAVIPNGVDVRQLYPGPKPEEKLKEFGITGKFVVLYLGTHGISQALGSIIDTAEFLKKETDIHFLFVGNGADKKAVMEKAEKLQLNNVSFFPGQPKDQVLSIYRCADICLVPLKNIPLFKTFIPSKMFEVMAAGIPLIACVEGESEQILERSHGGAAICRPENSGQLSETILELKNNPQKRKDMAIKGREFVAREYNRVDLANKYLAIIEGIKKRV